MSPTDPQTFHAALRALLIEHHVVVAQFGPRQTSDGQPIDDIEGVQDGATRIRVCTVAVFEAPQEVARTSWFAALLGLPGVAPPWPYVVPNAAFGGSIVVVRYLDGTTPPTRPMAGGAAASV
ncbi:MAG TPA: hypothetical protein VG755_15820 [Nannocystaceae bacterium]|nr:hypothetical protein [Nannocystaceae bacterium]